MNSWRCVVCSTHNPKSAPRCRKCRHLRDRPLSLGDLVDRQLLALDRHLRELRKHGLRKKERKEG